MKDLYLIRGVSGAGKSTFATSIACEDDVMVANDDFMVDEHGTYDFDWNRLDEVSLKAKEKVREAMKNEVPRIFVHNTFTTEAEMVPYMELAKEYGYRTFTLIIENRHGGVRVHSTPESTVEKQRDRFDIKL